MVISAVAFAFLHDRTPAGSHGITSSPFPQVRAFVPGENLHRGVLFISRASLLRWMKQAESAVFIMLRI
jgi:hypothetical protein